MKKNPLGKKTDFKSSYDPELLFAIPRAESRIKNKIQDIFTGYDIFNCYEFSYLNAKGKPVNKILRIVYSSGSANIVESKSLKLYLNSFIMTKFKNEEELINLLINDLSNLIRSEYIILYLLDEKYDFKFTPVNTKIMLDQIDIKTDNYKVDPYLLKTRSNSKSQTVEKFSNLLKTNCPITGQPDWASVYINYRSKKTIDDTSLLKYIISYRTYSGYHESTCEQIFNDIYKQVTPDFLEVKCFFTRRGGIDINPCRYYNIKPDENYNMHYMRQ